MIRFLSNTPEYISIFSALELLIGVSDCFLSHQKIRVTLERLTVDVTDGLSDISLV